MDFELLNDSSQKHPSLLVLLERLIFSRSRQWLIWVENPPHRLGALILGLVSFEIGLLRTLSEQWGLTVYLFGLTINILMLILLIEVFLVSLAIKWGDWMGKSGHFLSLLTYLNLSLVPALLFLPLKLFLLVFSSSITNFIVTLTTVGIIFKIIALWKESIELHLKLTKWQSALIFYASAACFFLFLSGIFYLKLFINI